MVAETYAMDDAGAGSETLLTCDPPQSVRTIAWNRQYRDARGSCYQVGHGIRTLSR
jgi:hypothetical protein